jgi:hypothetical protein
LWIEKKKTPLTSIKEVRRTQKCLLCVGEPPPVIFDESLLRRQPFQKCPSRGSFPKASLWREVPPTGGGRRLGYTLPYLTIKKYPNNAARIRGINEKMLI